jgi:hypothetical protein
MGVTIKAHLGEGFRGLELVKHFWIFFPWYILVSHWPEKILFVDIRE